MVVLSQRQQARTPLTETATHRPHTAAPLGCHHGRHLLAVAGAASDPPPPLVAEGDAAAMREELASMKVMALHRRALSEGIGEARLEEAMESELPKQAPVDVLLRAR